jgi:hypothetical protein
VVHCKRWIYVGSLLIGVVAHWLKCVVTHWLLWCGLLQRWIYVGSLHSDMVAHWLKCVVTHWLLWRGLLLRWIYVGSLRSDMVAHRLKARWFIGYFGVAHCKGRYLLAHYLLMWWLIG